MKIYVDNDYKCHVSNIDGAMREVDVPFFDGKCKEFIEGYRYIPDGEVWVNQAGVKCSGVSPWKDYSILATAQAAYEEGQATGTGGIDELVAAIGDAYTEGVNSI